MLITFYVSEPKCMRTANEWRGDAFLPRDCRKFSLWMSGPMYVGENIIIAIGAYGRQGVLASGWTESCKRKEGTRGPGIALRAIPSVAHFLQLVFIS